MVLIQLEIIGVELSFTFVQRIESSGALSIGGGMQ
jgi:hypothetical protein